MVVTELKPLQQLEVQFENTIKRGGQYTNALLQLDPRLLSIAPNETAAGFDVGKGADVVAFKNLGFRHARITNNQAADFAMAFRDSSQMEDRVLSLVLESNSPEDTYFSSLDIFDWIKMNSFSPRLITALRMAPRFFNAIKSNGLFQEIVDFHKKLKPGGTMVLSALNDHALSANSFTDADRILTGEGVDHQLFIDESVPPELGELGQRILVIRK